MNRMRRPAELASITVKWISRPRLSTISRPCVPAGWWPAPAISAPPSDRLAMVAPVVPPSIFKVQGWATAKRGNSRLSTSAVEVRTA